MLRQMLHIRRFEERASQAYQMQKIGGFCHLYIGQEAVVVGAEAAIEPDDYVITTYRDHGHAIVRGTSMNACMAELFGKSTGCAKGLGGSMHFFDRERYMYGGHAIVGGHLPLAARLAFASKYRKENRLTLCYVGDGGINIGSFHEALNLAQLWSLPVLYICENNCFGMGTSVDRACSSKEIAHRAKGYDMDFGVVDGMDVRKVREKIFDICQKMRKKPAPYFLEVRTYRYRGHSMSDPGNYRTKEEVEKYRKADPIDNYVQQLYAEKKLTEADFKQLDKEAKKLALESVKFAEESQPLPVEEVYNYTFVP